MPRAYQDFDYSKFVLGAVCGKKNEIADVAGVPRQTNFQEWSGAAVFRNCVVLFVTLDKKNRTPYQDLFDGHIFYWDSRSTASENTPYVRLLIEERMPPVLFARVLGSDPFVYCGKLKYISHMKSRPVHFYWELLDFPRGLEGGAHLERLAKWTTGAGITGEIPVVPSTEDGKRSYTEGAKRYVTGNCYERDPSARKDCMSHYGKACWVCGFDFAEFYGPVGGDFIFIHHRVPVPVRAKTGPYVLDPIRDLVPLCGNCHYIVHRKKAFAGDGLNTGALDDDARKRLKDLQDLARLDMWEDSLD